MTHPCPFQPPPACVQLSIGSCLRRAPRAGLHCIGAATYYIIAFNSCSAWRVGDWGVGLGTGTTGRGRGRRRLPRPRAPSVKLSKRARTTAATGRCPSNTRSPPCCAQFQFQPADRERPGLGSHAVASLSRCARGSSSTHQHAHVHAGGCMPARIRSVASQPCTRQAHHAALPGYGRGFVPPLELVW